MSLYPSLEDMKVDRLMQAQNESFPSVTLPKYASPPYPSAPPAYADEPNLPYPLRQSALYPALGEFMGLELTPAVIAANMPHYLPEEYQVATRPELAVEVSPNSGALVAPLTGHIASIQNAHVSNGIREVVMCKDGNGKLGLRLQAVNNGIFVSLVSKDSSAAKAKIRFGDQILQIGGKNVAGLSADVVHDMIKKAPNTGISFMIRDRPMERTVVLHKDSVGRVGFQFKNGKITGLVHDSSAARNGLTTEHQILEINSQNVVGLKDKEITQIITDCGSYVAVTIIPHFIYEHMTKRMASGLFGSMDHSTW